MSIHSTLEKSSQTELRSRDLEGHRFLLEMVEIQRVSGQAGCLGVLSAMKGRNTTAGALPLPLDSFTKEEMRMVIYRLQWTLV